MQKGFTLIEMIVVISIIAILATIVAPNAYKMIEKAKIAKAVTGFNTIASAANAYFSDTGIYPPNCANETACKSSNFFRDVSSNVGWNGPYLQQWPIPGWVSPEGNKSDFLWQGDWADFDGNGIGNECAAINFRTADATFSQLRGVKIDQALDDGNLSTGTFRSGSALTAPYNTCPNCVYYSVGEESQP